MGGGVEYFTKWLIDLTACLVNLIKEYCERQQPTESNLGGFSSSRRKIFVKIFYFLSGLHSHITVVNLTHFKLFGDIQ